MRRAGQAPKTTPMALAKVNAMTIDCASTAVFGPMELLSCMAPSMPATTPSAPACTQWRQRTTEYYRERQGMTIERQNVRSAMIVAEALRILLTFLPESARLCRPPDVPYSRVHRQSGHLLVRPSSGTPMDGRNAEFDHALQVARSLDATGIPA